MNNKTFEASIVQQLIQFHFRLFFALFSLSLLLLDAKMYLHLLILQELLHRLINLEMEEAAKEAYS